MNWSETKWTSLTFFSSWIWVKDGLIDYIWTCCMWYIIISCFWIPSHSFSYWNREKIITFVYLQHSCAMLHSLHQGAPFLHNSRRFEVSCKHWTPELNPERFREVSACACVCANSTFMLSLRNSQISIFHIKGEKQKEHWTAAHIPHLTTNTFHQCHWRVSLYPQDSSTGFSQGFVGLYNTILLCVNCFHLTIEAFKNESNVKPCVYVT